MEKTVTRGIRSCSVTVSTPTGSFRLSREEPARVAVSTGTGSAGSERETNCPTAWLGGESSDAQEGAEGLFQQFGVNLADDEDYPGYVGSGPG
jgi:hypothetical protein